MPARHLTTGRNGEDAAAAFLEGKGYQILARNWTTGGPGAQELDLVCLDQDTLVFVEVRTRQRQGMVLPVESLSQAKLRRLADAARRYLSENDQWQLPCRFDVVSVRAAGETLQMEHLAHAFDLSQALCGGDAAWQPW